MMLEYQCLLSKFNYAGSQKVIGLLLKRCARQLSQYASSAKDFRLSPSERGED